MICLEDNHRLEISAHGECDYPYEACGLLLGTFANDGMKTVHEVFPISNAREESAKRTRFLIRPQELMRGERHAQARSLDVLGFYHSHPDHPAIPSQFDLEHAWPVYSYIVISIQSGVAKDIRSWEMQTDRTRFVEEEILIRQTKVA